MTKIERFGSGSSYEADGGFSRAIRIDNRVIFTLTGPVMPSGTPLPSDAYGQGRRCLEIIAGVLTDAGGSLNDVVRTEFHLLRMEDLEAINHLHREVFGATRPVTKMLPVPALTEPSWLVEIEVEAILGATA